MQYFIEQVAENGFVLVTYTDFTSATDAELFYTDEGFTPITDGAGYRIVNEYGEDVTPTWWVE
jgi:hypothetical protein